MNIKAVPYSTDSLPSHWEVWQAKNLYDIQLGKMLQNQAEGPDDREVPYLKALNVQWEHVETSDLPSMWASPQDIAKYEVQKGDLLVCEGGEVGRAATIEKLDGVTIIQNALHRVRPRCGNIRFFMYLLRHIAATGWFDVLCNRATIAHLTGEKLAAILIPTPPLPEQRAIADFLDRKTQAIDALIQKKERLIVLLQEKRQALITQAVTKGLDPSVPMKDSGIEWLGEIPVHWDLIALRRFATFQRGHDLPQSSREEGRIPVVSSAGVSGTHCIAAAIGPGIVTGRYGSIGQFHYVETDYWPLNTALYTRDLHGNWPQFIFYALSVLSPLFVMESNKSAVPGVDRNDLHGYKIAVPPVQEQRQIATFLETATSELDQLVEKTQTSADRLREYRQALISAAVTGKIDVTKETI